MREQLLEDFWATWPLELMDRFGIDRRQAGKFCGMALKCGSVEKARQILGNVRESKAEARDVPRYIRQGLKEAG